MREILVVIVLAVCLVPAVADEIADGRTAVKLHLVKAGLWSAVSCKDESVDGEEFTYCHAAGLDPIGGLYAIHAFDREPVVYPVNVKAKQYNKFETIEKLDGSPVQVLPWKGNPSTVSAIRDAIVGAD